MSFFNKMAQSQISEKCMQLFTNDHGEQHDKFIHSEETYNLLITTLTNKDNFKYSNKSFEYRNDLFCTGNMDSICDHIVDDVEYRTLNPIYKRIRNTKNTRLLDRISKLDSITPYLKYNVIKYDEPNFKSDPTEFDVQFMRIFVQYALKKKLDDADYAEYEKRITEHLKAKDLKTTTGFIIEMAMSVCTIS